MHSPRCAETLSKDQFQKHWHVMLFSAEYIESVEFHPLNATSWIQSFLKTKPHFWSFLGSLQPFQTRPLTQSPHPHLPRWLSRLQMRSVQQWRTIPRHLPLECVPFRNAQTEHSCNQRPIGSFEGPVKCDCILDKPLFYMGVVSTDTDPNTGKNRRSPIFRYSSEFRYWQIPQIGPSILMQFW